MAHLREGQNFMVLIREKNIKINKEHVKILLTRYFQTNPLEQSVEWCSEISMII